MDQYDLMQKIYRGNKDAFAALYARYNDVVYRIAFNATNDQQASLEIVKAVFRTVLQTIKAKGPIEGDFYAWLDALTTTELRLRARAAEKAGGRSALYVAPKADDKDVLVPASQPKEERAKMPEAKPPVFQHSDQGVVGAPRKVQKIPPRTAQPIRPPVDQAGLPPIAQSPTKRPVPLPYEQHPRGATQQPLDRREPIPERRVRRYTPEEARAIEERARLRLEGVQPEMEAEGPRPVTILKVASGAVLGLLLLWLLLGLIMRMGILPPMDLGYGWFNETLFPLF